MNLVESLIKKLKKAHKNFAKEKVARGFIRTDKLEIEIWLGLKYDSENEKWNVECDVTGIGIDYDFAHSIVGKKIFNNYDDALRYYEKIVKKYGFMEIPRS